MNAAPARTNDFSIRVATVNGTGSQSANVVLLRALFQMGVTVSGKNLFPSNIAGLPTWFTIRLSAAGYRGARRTHEVLVALNPETVAEDLAALAPGGIAFLDAKLKLKDKRADVSIHEVPFAELAAGCCPDARLRKLVANTVYVGVLAQALGVEIVEVEKAIDRQFASKAKAVDLNVGAARAGFAWAKQNVPRQERFRVARIGSTDGKILLEGNTAAAFGAMFGGVSFVAWYPITPSSSLAEALIDQLQEHRRDAAGKATFAVVQAEDELAALGMVLGAGWSGARALTATSGPGISLMAEFAGLGYFAEIPAVIVDVQRVGPSTGLPTRTAQGDILELAFLSHGDTQHPLLFPAGPSEYFAMTAQALDIAAQLQTPIFVASDLDLGMNWWVDEPFAYPDKPLVRGKVLGKEDLDRLGSFARYLDVDGDGIGYRTLPGTAHPKASYFLRGSGHNEQAQYSERPEDYRALVDRLSRKLTSNLALLPTPELDNNGDHARIGVIAYGTSHWATVEARDRLASAGIPTSYLRVRSWPFTDAVRDFVAAHERIYVVDQNRDAQMAQLVRLAAPEHGARVRSVRHYDGHPIPVETIEEQIVAYEKEA